MLNPFTQLWRLITLPQQLDKLRKTIMAGDQDILNADAAAFANVIGTLTTEIEAIKAAVQNGQPLDFTALNNALASAQALAAANAQPAS